MAAFRFRLEKLLQLRQTELEQLEALAAHAAGLAQRAKQRHFRLLDQLNSLGEISNPTATQRDNRGQAHRSPPLSWNVVQASAEGLMVATNAANKERLDCEAKSRELSHYAAMKRIEVEALANLRERQLKAHRTAEQRRADHELQEQILRQWTLNHSYREANEAGSMNHG